MKLVIFLLFFATCLVIFYQMINWESIKDLQDARQSWTYSEQIDFIFDHIWNGQEESREAAWYRTVQHLQHGMYPDEMITEAQLRLLMLQYRRRGRSEYTVNSNGRLVHITEIGGPDEGTEGFEV